MAKPTETQLEDLRYWVDENKREIERLNKDIENLKDIQVQMMRTLNKVITFYERIPVMFETMHDNIKEIRGVIGVK